MADNKSESAKVDSIDSGAGSKRSADLLHPDQETSKKIKADVETLSGEHESAHISSLSTPLTDQKPTDTHVKKDEDARDSALGSSESLRINLEKETDKKDVDSPHICSNSASPKKPARLSAKGEKADSKVDSFIHSFQMHYLIRYNHQLTLCQSSKAPGSTISSIMAGLKTVAAPQLSAAALEQK